jgi:DNA invertase Pin-like site-specific DNA recombinase
MKVAIYCRVSTKDQTLEQQVESCRRYCEYQQLEVGGVYQEKVSGAKVENRPEYLRFVADVRAMQYGGVVVFRIDRLGRNARELVLFVEELDNKGIKIYSLNENTDRSTAMGRFTFDLICRMAQLEREGIGEATSQRLQSLKASGKRLGQKPCSQRGYPAVKLRSKCTFPMSRSTMLLIKRGIMRPLVKRPKYRELIVRGLIYNLMLVEKLR